MPMGVVFVLGSSLSLKFNACFGISASRFGCPLSATAFRGKHKKMPYQRTPYKTKLGHFHYCLSGPAQQNSLSEIKKELVYPVPTTQ